MDDITKKEGYVGVMFLLLAGIITPIILFLVIDLTQSYSAKAKLQDTVDRMARAAVFMVDEEELASGRIVIDTSAAYDRAAMVESFDDIGLFDGTPVLAVAVNEQATAVTFPGHQSSYTLDEAGVLVTGEAVARPLFVPRIVPLHANAAYEVTFKDKEEKSFTGTLPFGSLMATVVNPFIYEAEEEASTPDLHLAVGGEVAITLDLPLEEGESVETTLYLKDPDTAVETEVDASFRVPLEATEGTQLVLRATFTMDDATRTEEAVIGEVTHQLKEALRIDRVTHD